MKLKPYEQKVIEILFTNGFPSVELAELFSSSQVVGYEYTGSGYFLKLINDKFNFKEQTLYKPTVSGKCAEFTVGFLIYLNENEIVLECHSFDEVNPPENIRDYELEIR